MSEGVDGKLPVMVRGPDGKAVKPLDPDNPPAWLLSDPPDLCPRCLDTGVVVEEFNNVAEYCARYGLKPEDLDALERRALAANFPYRVAHPCSCIKNREIEKRFKAAVGDVPRPLLKARFEGVHRNIPYKVQALEAAQRFVGEVTEGRGAFLVFEGETGLGKTYAGLAALRAIIEAGGTAKYILSAELCDDLRERAIDTSALRTYRKNLKSKTAVFIDDFGWHRAGGFGGVVIDQYADFLRSYENGGGLIIATNRQGDLNATGFELAAREVFGDRADMIMRRLSEIQIAPAVVFGGQKRMGYVERNT